jgi:hypothetical protein
VTKNITLAVDAKTLKEARRVAVERDTTVNAMVRAYLSELAGEEAVKAKRRREMSRFLIALRKREKIGPVNWNRDAIYDRRIFSRH